MNRLGSGGMGIVYRARDLERDETVALKVLQGVEPAAILRLKNEFRSVANVTHPHLANLYELVCEGGEWFFTMEYVEGEDLRAYLRRAQRISPGADSGVSVAAGDIAVDSTVTLDGSAGGARDQGQGLSRSGRAWPPAALEPHEWHSPSESSGRPPLAQPVVPLAEILQIGWQLARGICALHAAGQLHRDIKPENVMVARTGRVVLLDFGLVSRLSSSATDDPVRQIAGTPAYLAPELAERGPASEASDWYAFGVVLYELITGRTPFVGATGAVLEAKRRQPAPLLPDALPLPDALRALCHRLLARDPAQRPVGPEVLSQLVREEPAWDSLGRPRDKLFLVGRDKELRALASALQLADDGHTVVVHVHGPSGMGKTALVERFLESTRTTRRVSIAAGRCYERESVPYKAFDSLVDSLGAQLQQLSDAERRATLPEHMLELAQLFPVLTPFAPTAVSAPKESAQPNVQEARARAMRALKQLLGRLANRSRLVLFIDDLQWSDSDSNVILGELMGPPASVPMLLICAYRSDPTVAPALLQAHRQSASTHPASLRVVDVPLASLEAADAALLVRALAENTGTEEEVRSIAVESGGLPLFIEELARRASTQRPSPAGLDGEMSLDRMILARVATLPEGARKLLEVIAVAGHPVAQGIAAVASEIEGGLNAGLTLLRSSHLARGLGFRNEDTIEAYHDRIRESVASSLSARAAAEIHFKLARAIEATDGADPEVLATHYFGAGVRDKAKLYAVEAAHRAGRAMAFDRAAELYKQALDCVPGDRLLTVRRAEALVNAGRSAEAAPLYLDAAGQLDQPDVERSELQRRAAEQLLVSGRIRGGVSLLRPLLEAVGLRYPSSPQRALFGIIARMTQMDLSSFRYLDRSPEEVPEFERRRIDLSWTAGKGLGSVDIMRGGYFIVRSTQLALRGGDSHRIARGLAHVGLFTAAQGRKKAIEKGLRLISEAEHIGRKLDDPHLIGFAKINAGTAYMTLSEWARAHEQLQEGVRLLEAHCTGVSWETSFAHVVSSNVLRFLGQIRDLEELGSEWQRIADSRGDLYGGVWIRLHTSTPLLAAGNAVAAY